MADSSGSDLKVAFDCPVCGDEVVMRATSQHNLRQESEPHQPNFSWRDEGERCEVHFSRCEKHIRELYDFIEYEVPLIFTSIPPQVEDEAVLEKAIAGMEAQNLGVRVEVELQDGRAGDVYAWSHSNNPSYYALTAGIRTPQNVLVSGSSDELRDVLEKWFYWKPDE